MTRGRRFRQSLVAVALAATAVAPAAAQVTSRPVKQGSGPVSEITRGIVEDSGPVYGDGGPVHGLSVERGTDGSVRGSTTGTVRAGAVKDITVGSVRTQLPPGFYAPRQREEADELRIDDVAEPQMVPSAEPVWDLRPLADTLRSIRPLPAQEPQQEEEGADDDGDQVAEEVQVPRVENPDAVDPTQLNQPSVPQVPGPNGVYLPAPPNVGAPSEEVPIPMPGSTPQPNYD